MQKEIIMVVKAENICTIQCGDGCATNIKAAGEVEKELGIKAPFSRCASHASHGKIMIPFSFYIFLE